MMFSLFLDFLCFVGIVLCVAVIVVVVKAVFDVLKK